MVKLTAQTQNVDIFLHLFLHFLKLFGIIWDVSGGSLEVLRSNVRQKYVHDCFCAEDTAERVPVSRCLGFAGVACVRELGDAGVVRERESGAA